MPTLDLNDVEAIKLLTSSEAFLNGFAANPCRPAERFRTANFPGLTAAEATRSMRYAKYRFTFERIFTS